MRMKGPARPPATSQPTMRHELFQRLSPVSRSPRHHLSGNGEERGGNDRHDSVHRDRRSASHLVHPMAGARQLCAVMSVADQVVTRRLHGECNRVGLVRRETMCSVLAADRPHRVARSASCARSCRWDDVRVEGRPHSGSAGGVPYELAALLVVQHHGRTGKAAAGSGDSEIARNRAAGSAIAMREPVLNESELFNDGCSHAASMLMTFRSFVSRRGASTDSLHIVKELCVRADEPPPGVDVLFGKLFRVQHSSKPLLQF
jgi:hypothetical protein